VCLNYALIYCDVTWCDEHCRYWLFWYVCVILVMHRTAARFCIFIHLLQVVTHQKVFLSKVALERDFRKKSTCVMKTFAIFLLSEETFTIRTCSVLESFFRKLLSKATFERKLSGASLPEDDGLHPA